MKSFTPEADDTTVSVLALVAGAALAIAVFLLNMPAAEAREIVTCGHGGCSDRAPPHASHRRTPARVAAPHRHKTRLPKLDANGNGSRLLTVTTTNGSHGNVAAPYRSQMQAILNDIEGEGYPIKYIGCWRKDWGVAGAHPQGRACDVCQWFRNRTDGRRGCRLPSNAELARIAHAHGCVHGGDWHGDLGPDRGHFECGRSLVAKVRKPWPRVVQVSDRTTRTP